MTTVWPMSVVDFLWPDANGSADAKEVQVNASRNITSTTEVTPWHLEPFPLAMGVGQAIGMAAGLSMVMLVTIVGNILVIVSVFTYRPLRSVQNMFLVSLAVADIMVAVLVMPFSIAYTIMGQWVFGLGACTMWVTFDVLCCTASILNLCAIALDRYWAIHDPIHYAQKRTLKRVLIMIFLVWFISAIISIPPLIGWNDWPEVFDESTPCRLTEEKGYIIYSSCGSFFIPLIIMCTVYFKIFLAMRRRFQQRVKAVAKTVKYIQPPRPAIAVQKAPSDTDINYGELPALGGSTDPPSTSDQSGTTTLSLPAPIRKPAERTLSATSSNGQPVLTARQYLEEKQKICLSKERRAARILGIVMGVFVLNWVPFFLMYVIVAYCDTCVLSEAAEGFMTWLGYVNSALNPVIYTVFNVDFRNSFRRILCCRR